MAHAGMAHGLIYPRGAPRVFLCFCLYAMDGLDWVQPYDNRYIFESKAKRNEA